MLISLFKAVLIMSCISTAAGAVLVIFRRFTKRLWGCTFQARVWYAVLLLALIPFSVSVATDVGDLTSPPNIVTHTVTEYEPVTPITQTVNPLTKPNREFAWELCSRLWLTVAIACFLKYVLAYIMFLTTAKKNSVYTESFKNIMVRTTDMLSAPLTVGLFKKIIYLPSKIERENEKKHILTHEYIHIKHHDILMKWICMIIKCVHWFNPAVRLICNEIDIDCEMACDYESTILLTLDEKKQYMNTILSLISRSAKPNSLTTQMANSKQRLTKRFAVVLTSKKSSRRRRFASCGAVMLVTSLLIFGSGVLCENIYGDGIPAIALNFEFFQNQDRTTAQNAQITVQPSNEEADITNPIFNITNDFSDAESSNAKTSSSTSDIPSKSPYKNDSHYQNSSFQTEPDAILDNSTKSFSFDEYDNAHSMQELPKEKPDLASSPDSKQPSSSYIEEASALFAQEDGDHNYYPYSGQVKFDGLTMDSLKADIEQSGISSTDPDNANLSTGYVSDTLSYKNGSINELKNVTCDENGKITFYMDSDYDRHITVSFSEDGKQIAGYGMVPDNETIYVFGGFDPHKTYDITVSSETGDTWKVESDYIIY